MKYLIQLDSVPNQSLSTALNDHDVDISVKSAYGLMFIDIAIDGSPVCAGVKCIPDVDLLPKPARELINGRLYFASIGGEYPSIENIGTKDCRLIYEEF